MTTPTFSVDLSGVEQILVFDAYQHRHLPKANGARWDAEKKWWRITVTPGAESKLATMCEELRELGCKYALKRSKQ